MYLSKIQKYWLHFFFLFVYQEYFLQLPVQLVALTKNNGGAAEDAVAEATEVPLASRGHSNRPLPIRRRRKDDPNNASSGASGQRADTPGRPLTQAHTNTQAPPYLLCLPPPERREPTHVSPRITLKENAGGGDWLLAGTNKVHSDLVKRPSHSASVSSHS